MKVSRVELFVKTLFLLTGLGSLIAIIILALVKETLPCPNIIVLAVVTFICWITIDEIEFGRSKEPQENEDTETTVS